jgi:hypothetical protein
MANKKFFLGMLVMALVIGMTVVGCEGEDEKPKTTPEPPKTKTPLTGTVSISSAVTVSVGEETRTLTASVSGSNSTSFSYQWSKDGTNISGATSSTYNVTTADYGKTLRVTITDRWGDYSGSQYGEIAVGNPTTLTLTLKRHATTWGKETGITIERGDGSYWKNGNVSNTTVVNQSSSPGSLTTTGATITLTSWKETQFKMRTIYQFVETKFYFKNGSSDSELFNLTNGAKTYILENVDGGFSILTGTVAREQ